MKTEKLAFMLSVCLAVEASAVTTNTWTGAENDHDWTASGNFQLGKPVAGDVVLLPAGQTARLLATDAESVSLVSSLERIIPLASDSVLRIETDAQHDVTLNCAISYPVVDCKAAESEFGEVVKTGVGALYLTRSSNDMADLYAYNTTFRVPEGELHLPYATKVGYWHYYRRFILGEQAKLFTVMNKAYTHVMDVQGTGTITNESVGTAGASCHFNVWGGTVESPVRLYVKLCPNLRFYSEGVVEVLSTDNTMTERSYVSHRAVLGFAKLGNDGKPSSLGVSSAMAYGEYGGTFRYLGTGESSTKGIEVQTTDTYKGPCALDAGPFGGLSIDGRFVSWHRIGQIVLTGTNAQPCFVNSPIPYYKTAGTNNMVTLTKRGVGTWRMNHLAKRTSTVNRFGLANVGVEGGTLQFESLYEKGEDCSLGTGTNCFPAAYDGLVDPQKIVPYSIALGDPDGKTVPTLEFAGTTNGAWNTTRAIALRGDAILSNASADPDGKPLPLRLANFSNIVDRTVSLILSGDGVQTEDQVANVTDGVVGKTAVVKVGTGTWNLSGANSFTGGLVVSNGTLKVLSPSGKYTWFRWTVKKTRNAGSELAVPEFGLYDSASNRVNGQLVRCADYTAIRAGQAAHGRHIYSYYNNKGTRDLDKLFDGDATVILNYVNYDYKAAFSPDDEKSWLPILMRLDPGCNEIATYDLICVDSSQNVPAAWTLEGSVDGFTWDLLDADDSNPYKDYSGGTRRWAISKQPFSGKFGNTEVYGAGRAINGSTNKTVQALSPDCPVRVCAGATLKAVGKVTLGNLEIDCSDAGTVDGFAFAEEGAISVINAPEAGGELPLELKDVVDAANVGNWSVTVNGVPKRSTRVAFRRGKLVLEKPGILIIVR